MKTNKIVFNYINYKKQSIYDFLKKKDYSDSNIYYLIKNNNVTIDNKIVKDKWEKLYFKSKIQVTLNDEENTLFILNKPLDIVYEDKYFMIVNKPFNLDIEPTKANYENNLAAMIGYYFKENNIHSKVHFINRLDKLTSGLVIVGKNQYIHNLFAKIHIIKKYIALVEGKTKQRQTIKVKLKKDDYSLKRIVCNDGKMCITKYERIKFDGKNTLVKIKLLTGRTHQIRASFAHIKHPLVFDPLYGNKNENGNMYLKANYLKFKHPITLKVVKIQIN